ncbi:MAG TPA: ester cyclase [Methanotrichaceae archaeon]|nr:ester cyclase [Methanotrichaceae archaeon]
MNDQLEANKAVARDILDLAFNLKRPEEAAAKYIGPRYRQHNPSAGDGAEPFIAFVHEFVKAFPYLRYEMKRQVAEGDLVAQHSHIIRNEGDPGLAVVDIFRLEGSKIVEHWDVIQEVPKASANDNTMF